VSATLKTLLTVLFEKQ